jgi:2-C-methyl-D-erythritol 2,4-cyclodiphosphate synthase
MKKKLSNILEIDKENIGIKATTTEKLGFTGREKGIAAEAVVGIIKKIHNKTV